MKNNDIKNLIKRIEKNSMCLTNSSPKTRKISKVNSDYIVFSNRRLNKSIVVNKNDKRLRDLLGL